jgi:ribosomal protein S18 acetylase RimI-like enzyme
LQAAFLPIQYPITFLTQLLIHPNRLCLVAHDSSSPAEIIAFVSAAIDASISISEPKIHILTLGVIPEHRRSGIALRLTHAVIARLGARISSHSNAPVPPNGTLVFAFISAANAPAKHLCGALGMHTEGDIRRDVYRNLSGPARDAYYLIGRVH